MAYKTVDELVRWANKRQKAQDDDAAEWMWEAIAVIEYHQMKKKIADLSTIPKHKTGRTQ